jgi:hypothetical protein
MEVRYTLLGMRSGGLQRFLVSAWLTSATVPSFPPSARRERRR